MPGFDLGIASDLRCADTFFCRRQAPRSAPPRLPDLIGDRPLASARTSVGNSRILVYPARLLQVPAKQFVSSQQLRTAQVSRSYPP